MCPKRKWPLTGTETDGNGEGEHSQKNKLSTGPTKHCLMGFLNFYPIAFLSTGINPSMVLCTCVTMGVCTYMYMCVQAYGHICTCMHIHL